MPTQAKGDGSLFTGEDPPGVSIADAATLLGDALTQSGWTVVDTQNDGRKISLKISRQTPQVSSLQLSIFIRRITFADRGEDEKSVQTNGLPFNYQADFALPNTGPEICLFLGSYASPDKTIFASWPTAEYRTDTQTNRRTYVKVSAIAQAMVDNFSFDSFRNKARAEIVVCCFQVSMFSFYIQNIGRLHRLPANEIETLRIIEEEDIPLNATGEDVEPGPLTAIDAIPESTPRNLIVYGAPGTGKSHKIQELLERHFTHINGFERVTFHPDYTYAQFVGSYRPVPIYREIEQELVAADKITTVGRYEPLIDYKFVPGPFLRQLVRALKAPTQPFVLVIEELNRANAPAVFGEVFQLLDRDNQGQGTFSVQLPSEARDYMRAEGIVSDVRLPKNLYLWATMNSADQGVLPLDAAFKRRWSFEYIPLNEFESIAGEWTIKLTFLPSAIKWNSFRKAINSHLLNKTIAEDRLLGPFFMRPDELASADAFKNKLLLYLRDDVVRHDPDALFRGDSKTYGALAKAYDDGENIFSDGITFELEHAG